MSTKRGDLLVSRLATGAGDAEEIGDTSYELLTEVFRGYPMERVLPLLYSADNSAVDAAAWIVSEQGVNATGLMPEISFLLDHQSSRARFWAVDAVLASARPEHGGTLAKAILLIADPEPAVRYSAFSLLTNARLEQLTSGTTQLPGGQIKELTTWLISTQNADEIVAKIDDADHLVALFGTAAASRTGGQNVRPLKHASRSADEEIAEFAKRKLGSPPWKLWERLEQR